MDIAEHLKMGAPKYRSTASSHSREADFRTTCLKFGGENLLTLELGELNLLKSASQPSSRLFVTSPLKWP